MSFVRYGREIQRLHIEFSSKCHLKCLGCAREVAGVGLKDRLEDFLRLEQLLDIFSLIELASFDHIYGCGNLGDSLMHPDLFSFFEFFKSLNPNAIHSVHTNGSLRNASYYRDLVKVMNPNQFVVFAIDGLEDTLGTYRVGSNWHKVMTNAQAVIDAGGRAQWQFIVFEHNQHQIEAARALSESMGFDSFNLLYSNRKDRQGITHVRDQRFNKDRSKVDCMTNREKELYVSAQGKIYPCCYIGSATFDYAPDQWDIDYDNAAIVNAVPMCPDTIVCRDICTR